MKADAADPGPCTGCRDGAAFAMPFAMAFQPIVDVTSGTVFAYEALVRGGTGRPRPMCWGR